MVQVYATMGGHMSMKGFQNDCEKYRAAQILGWRVLSYTATDIQRSPVQMIEEITSLLAEGRKVEADPKGLTNEPREVNDGAELHEI